MKKIFSILLPLLAFLTSMASPASVKPLPFRPAAATPIQFDVDDELTLPLFNECTGETIDMQIRRRISIRGQVNDQRVFSVYQTGTHYSGTGLTSGWRYVGHGQENGAAGGSMTNGFFIMNIVSQTVVTAPGSNNNYKVKTSYTLRVAPDGTVTKEAEQTSISCQ